ncbi:glycoside hydrolase domain-containing protein [Paraburkholderia nodosa]|uniref:glycoside hydrolase domain-containing protein n=1 Tax=Paraburkholderia nodosa TaxID=392320 RepID=UPI0004AD3C2E|nr:glycoside hydrolase domain-containing protein [Paraburkholderia nodosa]
MSTGIDTTQNCTAHASALRAAGYDFIGRYLSRSTWKLIGAAEASALRAAGLNLVLVYEDGPTAPSYFSFGRGQIDAQRAATQAALLGAQDATCIYFAVDYDASLADVNGCIGDYFKGVSAGLAGVAGTGGTTAAVPHYLVGAYGSGRTCRALQQTGAAQYTWLAQSSGWAGYDPVGSWSIVQGMPVAVAGVSGDPNKADAAYGAVAP